MRIVAAILFSAGGAKGAASIYFYFYMNFFLPPPLSRQGAFRKEENMGVGGLGGGVVDQCQARI